MKSINSHLAELREAVEHLLERHSSAHLREDKGEVEALLDTLEIAITKHHEELAEARASAAANEARTRTIIDTAVECIISTDCHGQIQSFNPACERLFGYTAEEAIGQNVRLLMPQPYRDAHDGYMARYQRTHEPHVIGIGRDVVARHRDGHIFPAELAINPYAVDGELHFVGTLRDVSARIDRERALEDAALHDPLTGALNRRGLLDGLTRQLGQTRGWDNTLCVLFIDLDGFKGVNDALGHASGDELLRAAVERMHHTSKPGDLVARIGGDELILVACNLPSHHAAELIAERLLAHLNQPVALLTLCDIQISASIGLAAFPMHGDSAEALLQAADAAMYLAKQAGKNTWRWADERHTAARHSAHDGLGLQGHAEAPLHTGDDPLR